MRWFEEIIESILHRQPSGEILVSSGASPSGVYHIGHLREVITCDAIVRGLRSHGREARHIHVIDDLDAFRKVPVGLPEGYDQYLGMPLCEVPAPDGTARSYADYCFDPFAESMSKLGIEVDIIYQHGKYREGFYVPAIERSLEKADIAKEALQSVSGRALDQNWTPIQIMEGGRLKNRRYQGIDTSTKQITYLDTAGLSQTVRYDTGEVKLDWRLDWPGRWWLMNVAVEPFGRDHATKGGSYDTGVEIAKKVYGIQPPIPVPYEFVNRTGDTKKMSASKGTGVGAYAMSNLLPGEVIRYLMLRYPPNKRLYFDETEGLVKLIEDYAKLLADASADKTSDLLMRLCDTGADQRTISSVPFSHLVVAYQASLGNIEATLKVLGRGEYAEVAKLEADTIRHELTFIADWLVQWAPEEMKFALLKTVDMTRFSDAEIAYLRALGQEIKEAPNDADGQWFHDRIYAYKDTSGLNAKELFTVLYRALIGKESGPRAGWFMSVLPRDWLIERLEMRNNS